MLCELTIRNAALIESLTIRLGGALSVLTGETGAGKSIVVDAVNLVLGSRADRGMIRTGAQRALIQAVFDIAGNARVLAVLDEMGIPCDDGLLTVTRELTQSGRNVQRLCGVVVQLAQLREVTGLLMDVHGQHEHQSLLAEARHLAFLDDTGGVAHAELLAQVEAAYNAWRETESELKRLTQSSAQREQRLDMLNFQMNELTNAKLKPGEEDALVKRQQLIGNAGKISQALEDGYRLIYQGDEREPSAQAQLKRVWESLAMIAQYDQRFSAAATRCEELYYAAQEIGYELSAMRDSVQYDPGLAEKIEARLDTLHRIKRKYGPSIEQAISLRESIAGELAGWENREAQEEQLARKLEAREAALNALCDKLSANRLRLKTQFEGALLCQLQELGMERARFEVMLTPSKPSPTGRETARFMISPNPGEPLRPLVAIASGGELSRVMLALKSIAAGRDGVSTMVFDEIDTGISGRMAQVVARKMCALAAARQVICVTHLPQIAAMADDQYLVEKRVLEGRTLTDVTLLDPPARELALSAMLSGAGGGGSALQHARELLASAAMAREAARGELCGEMAQND